MEIQALEKKVVQKVDRSTPVKEIVRIVNEDGGVILKGIITKDQVDAINRDLDPFFATTKPGTQLDNDHIAAFHGVNTKRVHDVVTNSKTFREDILDHDFVHEISTEVFSKDAGTYWMGAAQAIEIGPGSPSQVLHRDLTPWAHYVALGDAAPEAMVNFLIALNDFTVENGATRVIPGSNKWPDYRDLGKHEMTVPAELKAGDALFISGKVVHGGGANATTDFYRRAIAFNLLCSFLTQEEAFPLIVKQELAKTLPRRSQAMLGFRSQWPNGSGGLWNSNYQDIGEVLGL
ncbi:toxin biosynthesis protein [Cadophora sp. DSE1049]|nr:toxin biosynthesis protein [Cadophora sp. DSE1049]